MSTPWAASTSRKIERALKPQANPVFASGMKAYLKDQFEFLGVKTPERRSAVRAILKADPPQNKQDVIELVDILWHKKYREYVHSACDVLALYNSFFDAKDLKVTIHDWVITNPWWDSVDSLGSVVISPIARREPQALETMWKWLEDSNMWLNRAAIGYQRGFKTETDLTVVYKMCHRYASDPRFFISKAIGWELRDITAFNPEFVADFVANHPDLGNVARREAIRGLERSKHKSRLK
jgi:3-methyladenine DNA glycosylase AlkD